MKESWNRRRVLKQLAATSAAAVLPRGAVAKIFLEERTSEREIQITSTAEHGRLSMLPVREVKSRTRSLWTARLRTHPGASDCKNCKVIRPQENFRRATCRFTCRRVRSFSLFPHSKVVRFSDSRLNRRVAWSLSRPAIHRCSASAKAALNLIVAAQPTAWPADKAHTAWQRTEDVFRLPWIISTEGWAMFIHQPFGAFDFTGPQSTFTPSNAGTALDIFFVCSPDPAIIMAEYAGLTGHAEMPPLWSLGYQQSHRTLASREEVLAEAKTFREKKLPCDALIYLGTGFCPSGWNTENGSFAWNSRVFPDPKEMIEQLHKDNFRVVLHDVILTDKLHGTAHDPCELASFDTEKASCYWDAHRKDFAMGVDGWWPDEGDPLDIVSRLARNPMHLGGPANRSPE